MERCLSRSIRWHLTYSNCFVFSSTTLRSFPLAFSNPFVPDSGSFSTPPTTIILNYIFMFVDHRFRRKIACLLLLQIRRGVCSIRRRALNWDDHVRNCSESCAGTDSIQGRIFRCNNSEQFPFFTRFNTEKVLFTEHFVTAV